MHQSYVSALLVLLMASAAWAQDPPKQGPFEVSSGEAKIKFYGFARLDMIYDDSKPNDPQLPQWIRSEQSAPAALSTTVAREGDSTFLMHPKLTRFGIDITGLAIEKMGNAKASAKIEIDFYGATASESRDAFRMRHAWLKLSWEESSLLLGQTADVISPLMPIANNDMVMWNAGNLADRRPQIRYEYSPKLTDAKLTITAALGLTGAVDNQNLIGTGAESVAASLDGVDATMPTVQLRIGYEGNHFWMPGKKWAGGIWFHTAKEEGPDDGAPINGEDSWTSTAFGIDLALGLMEGLSMEMEFWSGSNLDDVRGGIGQGVNTTVGDPDLGKEIDAKGGWIQFGYVVGDTWTAYLGYSFDDPDGGLPAAGARDKNTVIYIANRLKMNSQLLFGVDLLLWTTEWNGTGMDDGTDTRLNLFAQWNF